jgi:hypothetical protein
MVAAYVADKAGLAPPVDIAIALQKSRPWVVLAVDRTEQRARTSWMFRKYLDRLIGELQDVELDAASDPEVTASVITFPITLIRANEGGDAFPHSAGAHAASSGAGLEINRRGRAVDPGCGSQGIAHTSIVPVGAALLDRWNRNK